jgi:arylsulfatase A-like enzyme
VSYVDAQIGKVLDTLDRLDLADDTVVVLFADHGWHLGEHDFWGKHNTLNNALHVPLIIRAPGRRGNRRTASLVEWADIYPTLCDLAGIPAPAYLEGASLAPLLDDPKRSVKEAVYARWEDGRSVKTDRYLYTEWSNGEQMLFDHEKDREENANIADDPKMADVVAAHRRLLTKAFPQRA